GLPGPSWSSFRLAPGIFLAGETHEPAGNFDPTDVNVHLFGSNDGGRTFTDVLQRPFIQPTNFTAMLVQFAYASSEFPIQITERGRGAVLGRVLSTRPVNTVGPTVSGPARDGQTLTATAGTWSGATPITSAFQWQRCPIGGICADLAGATSATYRAVTADVAF